MVLLEGQLQSYDTQHAVLSEIAVAICEQKSVKEIGCLVPDRLKYLLDFERCTLVFFNRDGTCDLVPAYESRELFQKDLTIKKSLPIKGIVKTVIRDGTPNIFRTENGVDEVFDPLMEQSDIKEILYAPILVNRKPSGVIIVGTKFSNAYRKVDVCLMRDVAQIISGSIERFKQIEELTVLNQDLKKIAYVASHDLRTPVRHILQFSLLAKKGVEQVIR